MPNFKTLLDAAVTMGEFSQAEADYFHGLYLISDECRNGDADEVNMIDVRDRAARLCQLAETEAVLKPAREIIIICELALARRNP